MKMFLLWRALAAGLLMTLSTQAATKTWTGQSVIGSRLWSDGFNWSPVGAPAAGDSLVFPPMRRVATLLTNDLPVDRAFANVTLQTSEFYLYGNRITLNGQFAATYPTNTTSLNELPLRLGANATITCNSADAFLNVHGDINLNGHTLFASGHGKVVLRGNLNLNGGLLILDPVESAEANVIGVISGTGQVTKRGLGDSRFAGTIGNSYNGPTFVEDGRLFLERQSVCIPRDLFIGTLFTAAIVELAYDGQIAANANVTIYSPAGVERSRLRLNEATNTIGSLTLTRGYVSTSSGQLTLDGDMKTFALSGTTNNDSGFFGNLKLGAGTRHLLDVAGGTSLSLEGRVIGRPTAWLVKTNSGDLEWSATAQDAYLEARSGRIFTCDNPTYIALYSATLIPGCDLASPTTLEVRGPGSRMTPGSIFTSWYPSTILNEDLEIFCETNRTLQFRSGISGPFGFRKTGDGTMTLMSFDFDAATNSYTGTSAVARGELLLNSQTGGSAVVSGPLVIGEGPGNPGGARVRIVNSPFTGTNQIADHVLVTVNTNGLFNLDGRAETIGGLTGAGEANLGTNATLTVAGDNQTNIFAGRLTGQGVLRKAGNSRLLINGTNTFTGGLQVVQGVLAHNGASSNASAFVARNATLTGNGILSSLLTERGGIISPSVSGTNPFTVRVSTRLDEAVFDIQLFGGNRRSHQLRAHGGVLLGDSTLVVTAPLGVVPTNGQRYIILDKTSAGPVNGTFAGLPEGAHFFAAGVVFQITYAGGDGNDIAITRRAGSLLTGLELVGEDYMHIRGQGTNGATYILEATPHLLPPIPWVPIATNIANPLGQYELIDLEPFYGPDGQLRHTARFYRVKVR